MCFCDQNMINKSGSFFPKSGFLGKSEITVCKFEACFAELIDKINKPGIK